MASSSETANLLQTIDTEPLLKKIYDNLVTEAKNRQEVFDKLGVAQCRAKALALLS